MCGCRHVLALAQLFCISISCTIVFKCHEWGIVYSENGEIQHLVHVMGCFKFLQLSSLQYDFRKKGHAPVNILAILVSFSIHGIRTDFVVKIDPPYCKKMGGNVFFSKEKGRNVDGRATVRGCKSKILYWSL